MEQISSTLKPDVFRSFAIYICPGVVAVTPWIYGYFWPDGLARLMSGNGTFLNAGLVLFVALVAGLILEDIGGHIEYRIDNLLAKESKTAAVTQDFWRYMATPSSPKFVADKFLSATVTRYKFELSMVPALGVAATAFLKMLIGRLPYWDWMLFCMLGLALVGSVFLYREAKNSALLLHKTRLVILAANEAANRGSQMGAMPSVAENGGPPPDAIPPVAARPDSQR